MIYLMNEAYKYVPYKLLHIHIIVHDNNINIIV